MLLCCNSSSLVLRIIREDLTRVDDIRIMFGNFFSCLFSIFAEEKAIRLGTTVRVCHHHQVSRDNHIEIYRVVGG